MAANSKIHNQHKAVSKRKKRYTKYTAQLAERTCHQLCNCEKFHTKKIVGARS